MGNPRCNCGAREGTAHAINCTVYYDNIDKRIADLEAEVERLQDALLTLNHRAAEGEVSRDLIVGITGMALEASDA